MPQLRVNMTQTDESREQPLRTSVTVAQAYISNGEIKADDRIGLLSESVLDFNIYEQKKNQGDEVKVSVKEAYGAAFYYDEDSATGDGLTQLARDFCRHKTRQVASDARNIPWRYNPANDEAYKAREDINYESPYDYNTANMKDIAGKEKLRDMRGWRDQFVGVTYVPTERIFRLPQRIADFELAAIPPKWVHRGARGVAAAACAMCTTGMDFDAMMDETADLLHDIDDAEITDDYLVALINTNVGRMFDYSRRSTIGAPAFNPSTGPTGVTRKESRFANAAQLDEWRPNRFGALDLPKKNGRIKQVYPPFFDSAPGLQTLAKEYDDPDSDWKEPGARAKRVLAFWELFVRVLQQYIGPSDVIDECLTPPWFHVQSPITVLLDSFRHYKAPLFLALPSTLAVNATSVTEGNQNRTRMTQYARDSKIAIDAMIIDGNFNNVPMLSNLTKFAVILRTYTASSAIDVGDVTDALQTSNPTRVQLRLINAMHKVIDFTVAQAYNMNVASASTLNVIVYYTRKIRATLDKVVSATEEEAKEMEASFDVFVHSNKSKKASAVAMEAYESIKGTPGFMQYENNLKTTNDVIVLMKERERELKQGVPRVAVDGSEYSYDDRVQAANDLERLGSVAIPGETAQDSRRRASAKTTLGLGEAEGLPADSVQARVPVGSVQMKIGAISIDRYLRAPLMASSRLLEYMQRTASPLVKPSDPLLFHEVPLEFVTEESLSHDSFHAHRKGTSVHCASMPYSQIFKTGLSALKPGATTAGSSNIFGANLRIKKSFGLSAPSSKSMGMDRFKSSAPMTFGTHTDGDHDYDDYGHQRQQRAARGIDLFQEVAQVSEARTKQQYTKSTDAMTKYLQTHEYFGPHQARDHYSEKNIASPFVKLIYKAINLARNRVTVHERLANIGQKLLNVVILRLFIQHIMSSTVVMKSGRDTMRTAVGHGKVWLNTEQRGINIINAGFYLGIHRTNPKNIGMMPFTHPEGFVGGMNTDFMRDISHFRHRTNDKESMIAMLSPVQEVSYEWPLHAANLPTFQRRDTDNAPHLRKWSSSEFLEFVVGDNALLELEGQIDQNKRSYGHAFDISLCINRGYVRYNDAFIQGKQRQVAGTGPRGAIRQNILTAADTWSGASTKFPDLQSDLLLRQ